MTKNLVWIALPVIGFCLALFPRPKIVFSVFGVGILGAIIYVVSNFQGEQRGVLLMAVAIGGPWAVGLLAIGALVGAWSRKYATTGKLRYTAVIATIVFGSAAVLIFKSDQNEHNEIEQKQLALDFVKQNQEIMRQVGGNAEVDVVTAGMTGNKTVSYDIGVRGQKTIYAIVEVSRQSGKPVFTLACTTSLYFGHRDPHKHPCTQ
jgi:hypothetical protein